MSNTTNLTKSAITETRSQILSDIDREANAAIKSVEEEWAKLQLMVKSFKRDK